MEKGENMDIEIIGVAELMLLFAKTDYFAPYIYYNDKTPIWDGEIFYYSSAEHKKENFIAKFPVQVKTHIDTPPFPDEVPFPIELSQFQAYLNDGGIAFFVIYSNGSISQIYYNNLLPYELKHIISTYHDQKTYSIRLTKLPTNQKELNDLFVGFIDNRKRQFSYITADNTTQNDLLHDPNVKDYKIYLHGNDPMGSIIKNGTYLYAQLPYGMELPVERFQRGGVIRIELPQDVKVNNAVFFHSFTRICSLESDVFIIGNCLRISRINDDNTIEISFHLSGNLSDRIKQLSFYISVIQNGDIDMGTSKITLFSDEPLPDRIEKYKVPNYEQLLSEYKEILAFLHGLHVSTDLDVDQMSEDDFRLLWAIILSVNNGIALEMKPKSSISIQCKISNIHILLLIEESEDRGKYYVYNPYDAPIIFSCIDKSGNAFPSSLFTHFSVNSLLGYSNLDCGMIWDQLNSVPFSKEYENDLILFYLEIIKGLAVSKTNIQLQSLANNISSLIIENHLLTDSSSCEIIEQLSQCILDLNAEDNNDITITTSMGSYDWNTAVSMIYEKYCERLAPQYAYHWFSEIERTKAKGKSSKEIWQLFCTEKDITDS